MASSVVRIVQVEAERNSEFAHQAAILVKIGGGEGAAEKARDCRKLDHEVSEHDIAWGNAVKLDVDLPINDRIGPGDRAADLRLILLLEFERDVEQRHFFWHFLFEIVDEAADRKMRAEMSDEPGLIRHLAFEGFELVEFLQIAVGLPEFSLACAEQGLPGAHIASGDNDPEAE